MSQILITVKCYAECTVTLFWKEKTNILIQFFFQTVKLRRKLSSVSCFSFSQSRSTIFGPKKHLLLWKEVSWEKTETSSSPIHQRGRKIKGVMSHCLNQITEHVNEWQFILHFYSSRKQLMFYRKMFVFEKRFKVFFFLSSLDYKTFFSIIIS